METETNRYENNNNRNNRTYNSNYRLDEVIAERGRKEGNANME